jgi:Zn finger protein HypA/HybF involved in hydrogenase expression
MPKTKYTKEILKPIVEKNISIAGVLKDLNLKNTGGNYSHIKKCIKNAEISMDHFLGQSHSKGKQGYNKHTKESFIEKVLKEGTGWRNQAIKEKLLEFNLKEDKCEVCGQSSLWNGKKLSLQIDHINGIFNDNRFENLRIICPNCHSQTDTFSSKIRN